MQTRRKRLAFSSITIISTLILLEVLFQMLAIMFPKVNVLLSQTETVKTIDTINAIKDEKLGWRPNPQHPEHDSKGFRNKNVPSRAGIVALGDSQTYGTGVTPTEAWPQQLELLSGNTTYNMAFGGYGPAHSLILFKEAMEFNPKIIISTLYAGNDLYDSFSLVYDRKQLPGLKASDPDVLRVVADLDNIEPITERINRLYMMGGTEKKSEKEPEGRPWTFREFIANYSKLYGLLRATKFNSMRIFHRSPDNFADWKSIEKFAKDKKEYCQVFNNGQFRTVFTSEYRLCALNLSDPRILEGYRISLEAIREMNARATQSTSSFVVLLIPTKELVFKESVLRDTTYIGESYHDLVTNEELFWQGTKNFLEEQGIDFIDSLQALRACLKSGRQPYAISSDGHPNGIGHRAIAELILSKINEYRLLKKK